MPIRFRRSKSIAPGIRLNVSRRGLGVRLGPRGAGVSFNPTGVNVSGSIPGTGLSATQRVSGPLSGPQARSAAPAGPRRPFLGAGWLPWAALIISVLFFLAVYAR